MTELENLQKLVKSNKFRRYGARLQKETLARLEELEKLQKKEKKVEQPTPSRSDSGTMPRRNVSAPAKDLQS